MRNRARKEIDKGKNAGNLRDNDRLNLNMSLRHFLKYTACGRLLVIPFRLGSGLRHCARELGIVLRWVVSSKEHYNHTFDLTDLNKVYLANFVAAISGHPVGAIQGYIRELEGDEELRSFLRQRTDRKSVV